MRGLHLTADLHDCRCDAAWLTDAARLGAFCVRAVREAGLRPVAELFHAFPSIEGGGGDDSPGGVTATVLLAESHLCAHTWPERRAVTLDVYVCNIGGDHSEKARALMRALCERFEPASATHHAIERGLSA